MTKLTIPVRKLAVTAPCAGLIPASELADYLKAGDIIAKAQGRAAQLRRSAQKHLSSVVQQCADAREKARQEALAKVEQETPALRQQAVANTIQWLVAEHELESNIVQRLEPRLRSLMAQVTEEFFRQQDSTRLLMDRLRPALDRLLNEDAATLQVNPQQWEALHQSFAAYPSLRVQSCDHIAEGQAILITPLIYMSLDLEEQLDSRLSRLKHVSEEAADDYSQD